VDTYKPHPKGRGEQCLTQLALRLPTVHGTEFGLVGETAELTRRCTRLVPLTPKKEVAATPVLMPKCLGVWKPTRVVRT
jgi:hypothetical protein